MQSLNPGRRAIQLFTGKGLIAGLAATLLALMFVPVLGAQNTGIAPSPATDLNSRLARLELQAADAKGSADNAWMLTSSALVLMMTGPGLALFYGGLVRKKTYWPP